MSRKIVTIFIIILMFLSLGISLYASEPKEKEQEDANLITEDDIFYELSLFADALTLVDANYVRGLTPEEMIYGALEGMLSSLDSHSSFLTPDEFTDIQTETLGEFGGVGIKITSRDHILTVVSPLEGTPAEKSGILPNDKIVEIDGESTKDFNLDDAVKVLRGVPGTEVVLTILREDEDKLLYFTLKRAIIKIESIKEPFIIKSKIGYIRIADFQRNTSRDLDRALKSLLKKGMKALILDLRNNPGGLLKSSVDVSEKFLEKGKVVVTTQGRIKQQNAEFRSNAFRIYNNFPIAVLINQGSASASEIVAGALKDNKRAVTVGKKSFGKGSVQTVIPMRDGSALRLTTSYYHTPSGAIIHEKGIIPDIEVDMAELKNQELFEKLSKLPVRERLREDAQVKAAIDLLQDKKRYLSLLSTE